MTEPNETQNILNKINENLLNKEQEKEPIDDKREREVF